MKKLTKVVLALAVVATSITACKKGDDDPGLSLKSRKGRLSQEWNVSDYADEKTSSDTYTDFQGSKTVTTTVSKETYTGATADRNIDVTKVESSSGNPTTTTNTNYSYKGTVTAFDFTIEKDGTWKSTKTVKWTSLTTKSQNLTDTEPMDYTETTISEGNWSFVGKNKTTEDKNKENVMFSTTKENVKVIDVNTTGTASTYSSDETTTYANNEMTSIWHLSRLAKDEVIADGITDNAFSGSNNYSGTTGSSTVPKDPNSTKGTVKITLAKK